MKKRNRFWWLWCGLAALALALLALPGLAEEKAKMEPQVGTKEERGLEQRKMRKVPPKETKRQKAEKPPEASKQEPKKVIPITIPDKVK